MGPVRDGVTPNGRILRFALSRSAVENKQTEGPPEMTQKTRPQIRIGFSCAIAIRKRNVLSVFGRSGGRSTTLRTRDVCETMSGVGVGQPGSQKEPCRRAYDEALLCSVHSSGVFRSAQTGRIWWAWPVPLVDRTSTLRAHKGGQLTLNEDPPVRTLFNGEGAIDELCPVPHGT